MGQLDSIWEQLFPAEQQRIVRLLIEKVIVSPDDLEVRFRSNGIEVLALEQGAIAAETAGHERDSHRSKRTARGDCRK